MLTECEGLSSTELPTLLFDAAHASFAGIFMLLVAHLDIKLRRASQFVVSEKGAVSPIKNVYLRVCEIRVPVSVALPVFTTNIFRPGIR